MTNREVADGVPTGLRMPKPISHECTDEIYKVMCQCWVLEPCQRPTFTHFHEYFKDFDIANESAYAHANAVH